MILEKQKQSQVLIEGESSADSIAMSLDMDSAGFLMQMLSKNIYSDDIGSTIRETVSNALDSTRKAKSDQPVIVSFKQNNGIYEFSVEDFGIGLDDSDVHNIISKYGKSTKRDSQDELGMWGLGFKSPLAYASSFHFRCRKDGKERTYMMYEGEDVNTIDLLAENDTTELNGVKVTVSVKQDDVSNFYYKIKEQLAYFENVYFNVEARVKPRQYSYYFETKTIDNDFKIHRSKNYQWSELLSTEKLHICLDNVYYPIDFEKIGISDIDLPIGLRFNLTDGIFPTINREAIRYTPETKAIILDKIKIVADELVDMYNATVEETDNIYKIIRHYKEDDRWVTIDEKMYNIRKIAQHASSAIKEPTLKGVSLISLKKIAKTPGLLTNEYRIKYRIENDRFTERIGDSYVRVREDDTHTLIHEEFITKNKRAYLKDLYHRISIVKKVYPYKLFAKRGIMFSDHCYYEVLKLGKHPRSEWRDRIKEFQYVQSLVVSQWKSVDDIDIPQEWLDERKKKRVTYQGNKKKLDGEISCKVAEPLERHVTGQYCKFVAERYNVRDISKFKGLVIYAHNDNRDKLDSLYNITTVHAQRFRLIIVSSREFNNLEKLEVHNLISYENFMKGENKPFKRIITAYLIRNLIYNNRKVFECAEMFKTLSSELYDTLIALKAYKESYYYTSDSEVYDAMLEIAEANDLFDTFIYDDYLKVDKLLKEYKFIGMLCKMLRRTPYYQDGEEEKDFVSIFRDMFKYYRYRLDYPNYIKIDEEKEEEVEEELEELEELTNKN